MQVDPKSEKIVHLSPYQGMNNNPISYFDPDGDLPFLAAVGIGALIGGGTGAIQSGWSGFWKGALIGGAAGAASFGLGSLTSAMSTAGTNLTGAGVANSLGTLSTLTNIGGHAGIGGLSSLAGGGNFESGALSGGFSAVSGLTLGGLGDGGQLAAGALSGGVGSVIGGGNFWQGAGQGLITVGLNHLANHIPNRLDLRNATDDQIIKKFEEALAKEQSRFNRTGEYRPLDMERYFKNFPLFHQTHIFPSGFIQGAPVNLEVPVQQYNRTKLKWGGPDWNHEYFHAPSKTYWTRYTYAKYGSTNYPLWNISFPTRFENVISEVPGF